MGLSLLARNNALASTDEQNRILARTGACPPFEKRLGQSGLNPLHATGITVFQINVGKLCNQTCRHCHVDAGPERREQMTRETAELCMRALAHSDIPTVDITGGAPELNANFRGSLVISGVRNYLIFQANKAYPDRSRWIRWNKCLTFRIP